MAINRIDNKSAEFCTLIKEIYESFKKIYIRVEISTQLRVNTFLIFVFNSFANENYLHNFVRLTEPHVWNSRIY